MRVVQERIPGVLTIELQAFTDERGFFLDWFSVESFRAAGVPTEFCQDNHSRSKPGVLRGLHYQTDPAQGKLVGVVRGRIWDVAVDIRPDSPTFGARVDVELNGDDGRLLWLPAGIAHGFCVIGNEPADVVYKVDRPVQQVERGRDSLVRRRAGDSVAHRPTHRLSTRSVAADVCRVQTAYRRQGSFVNLRRRAPAKRVHRCRAFLEASVRAAGVSRHRHARCASPRGWPR